MNTEKTFIKKALTFSIFAGPTTIAFLAVVILPFIYGIYITFTNWNGIDGSSQIIGFANYFQVFKDKEFWHNFGLTFNYVIATVIITNVFAFFLAYILTSGVKFQNFFRAGFFTPNLIGGILLGFIWQFLFSSVITYMAKNAEIPFLSSSMLSDPHKAFWAMVIVSAWQYSGYMMIIYIAGFMNVPKDVIEASQIDGATTFHKLKSIILPLMIPSFTICLFLTIQRGFMVYDVNLALTKGGPFGSTTLVSMHVYNKAFLSQQYGVGQAEAFALFICVAIVTVVQVYLTKKMEVEA